MAGLFKIVMCWLWWPPRGVSSRALGKREGPDGDKWSRPRRKRWEGPKRTKVSGVLSAAITDLLYNHYLHQRSSQSKYSRCQNRAFCGWRIQWHSSGNMISLDGTPII